MNWPLCLKWGYLCRVVFPSGTLRGLVRSLGCLWCQSLSWPKGLYFLYFWGGDLLPTCSRVGPDRSHLGALLPSSYVWGIVVVQLPACVWHCPESH